MKIMNKISVLIKMMNCYSNLLTVRRVKKAKKILIKIRRMTKIVKKKTIFFKNF